MEPQAASAKPQAAAFCAQTVPSVRSEPYGSKVRGQRHCASCVLLVHESLHVYYNVNMYQYTYIALRVDQ